MVGDSISHYKILQQLGKGGMGVVYEAEDTRLGRNVALKFLPEQLWNDAFARERLQREARAASALNHPNICTIYDIGEDDGHPFIVMERLHGQPLSHLIAARRVNLEAAIELAIQVADALETAHSKSIIHRDLKPANLFITDRMEAKVLDFGLAKTGPIQRRAMSMSMTAMETAPEHLTSPGAAVGTVAYMSPEQARGEDVDARSDLFSFGAVLYEMTTGTLPFSGVTSAVLFDAILNRQPVPPSRLNPEMSPDFERIILKCLEKERDLRYQSASELKADLKRLRRDSRTSSTRIEAAPAPTGRENRRWVWAIPALVFVAAVLAVWRWATSAPEIAPQSQWVQLTDFNDSVVYPAVSPDGRMLAFVRGSDAFLPSGDLYLKLLPNGEPVRLTHDGITKMGVAFTPDSSAVTYTVLKSGWVTYMAPVLGGEPRMFLPNAENLHVLSDRQLLFSEIKSGIHMALVTSGEGRTAQRDIYVPETDRGMAHLSALSPNGKQVLITEMGPSGEFGPCRLLPFDGSNTGLQVGPAEAPCMGVGWSPDGKWMYLNVNTGDGLHLWRQRGPRGKPEQITFGPSQQAGIALTPDGSLVTAVGGHRVTVWLSKGSEQAQQIYAQGNTYAPVFSPDATRLFFLRLTNTPGESGQLRLNIGRNEQTSTLMSLDLSTNQVDSLFAGLTVRQFDVSPDGKRIILEVAGSDGKTQLWLASPNLRSAPQRINLPDTVDEPHFLDSDELLVRVLDSGKHYIERMHLDGSNRQRIWPQPIADTDGLTPDRQWFIGPEPNPVEPSEMDVAAHAVDGSRTVVICKGCLLEWGNPNVLYVDFGLSGDQLIALPIEKGSMFPQLPPGGIASMEDALKMPGAKRVDNIEVKSPNGNWTAVTRHSVQRNLYLIPVKK